MLKQLIGFEISYHARQVGFWVTVAVMLALGVLVMSTDAIQISATSGERVKANGAITIAIQASALSLLSIFFGALFVVSGVMRDQAHKAVEVIHSTAVTTRDLMLSRLIGVYIACFFCIFATVIGLFIGQFMPWMDQESLGPINPLYFLQPSLVYIAVNTLFVSGFFTIIAGVTRNRALVYVSAVGLFILFTASGLLVNQETAADWLVSLVDPFGSTALAIVVEFWPAAEQNTQMSPLGGYIGLNRLIWGALGLGFFVASFMMFRRGLLTNKAKSYADDAEADIGKVVVISANTNMAFGNTMATFWTRLKYEYLTTARSVPFIILTLLAISLFALVIYVQLYLSPNPQLLTSSFFAQVAIGAIVIPLLIIMVFFSGEIVWRDKTVKITEILDASPVRNWPLLAAKWLALILVAMTMLGVGIVFGVVTQLSLSDIPVNISTYLTFTFITFAPRIVLSCLLILFVQNFMPNRIVGMLASAALLIFFFFFINNLPFYHPLMGYGIVPSGGLSEINGYHSLISFKWFGLYWASLGGLFVVLSIWLWRRGVQNGLWLRLKSIGQQLSLPSAAFAILFAGGFVGTGGYIYKVYNIDNNFRTSKERELRQVKWETAFGDISEDAKDDEATDEPDTETASVDPKPVAKYKAILPKIRSVEVEVTFQPSKQTATVTGHYIIENSTGAPLDEVYVGLVSRRIGGTKSLTLDGATAVTDGDDYATNKDFGYRLYRFEPALAPGAKTNLSFETYLHGPRLGTGSTIRRNGTFVNNFVVMPQLGIQDSRMANPDRRRKYDLPEREKRANRTNLAARQNHFISASSDYVDFKASVCTDIGQIPIAPGKLIREYENDGKACRDYQAINPILNFFSFLSADYTVAQDVWENPNGNNVELAIYHHGPHDYNVPLMLDAMKSSLDTFTSVFGPYQYSQVRIMEFPYGGFAQAFAGTIPFSENIGFVMDPGDPTDNDKMDLATYVTMHEIGHQWFAHQIVPANTKGFNVLSEGLTENATLTAYEAKLGWQKARRALQQRSIQGYLAGRTGDRSEEPPLAKAEGQAYLFYNKANWVFWGLKQNMGEAKMQGAIRAFLDDFGSKGPPYPTTKELVEYLRAAASDDMQVLITDYWDRITFWDMKFLDDSTTVKPNASGGYTVEFTAVVDKLIASEEDGKETSVSEIEGEALQEWVEVGFYDKDPTETLGGDWLQLERVHIHEAETKLSFELDERPNYIVLDPRRLLIERNVDDNQLKLPDVTLAEINEKLDVTNES
ncbi:MAG: hypothetical protein JKX99_10565 [Robiginitomaculum sp.]|nr:hypothetical protein [Robiginitomaculum sp.]